MLYARIVVATWSTACSPLPYQHHAGLPFGNLSLEDPQKHGDLQISTTTLDHTANRE